MEQVELLMDSRKRIALVAHDNKKKDMLEWAKYNRHILVEHDLFATGTTGKLLEEILETPIQRLQSGPWGATSRSAQRSPKGRSTF